MVAVHVRGQWYYQILQQGLNEKDTLIRPESSEMQGANLYYSRNSQS